MPSWSLLCISDWAKEVWDSDFTEVDSLDDAIVADLNLEEIVFAFDRLKTNLDFWVKNEGEQGDYMCIGLDTPPPPIKLFLSLVLEKVCKLVMTFLEDIFSRHAILHKFVTINKSGWKSR